MTHGNFLPKELRPSYRVLGQYTAVFWLILTFLGSGVSGRPPGPEAGPTAPARWLSLEERVSCQWAIERVYWRHRIWPRENPQPKPALEAVVSEDAVRAKVEDGLRKSAALGRYWGHFLRPEDLQAEMDRMGRQTRRPEVLRELFAALGGDANRVAECLVRPLLAERWIRSRYAWDERFHGALRERVKAEVGGWEETGGVRGLRGLSGRYEEVEWVKVGEGRGGRAAVEVPAEEWAEREGELAEVMGWERRSIPVGRVSGLREDEERLYVGAVLERGEGRMVVATVVWEKRAFEDWWSEVRGGVGLEEGRSGEGGYVYHLPAVNATACVDDTWERIPKASSPSARAFHTAVWTGTEMIVWGGDTGAGFTNTGGRYNPGTDTWTATSTTNAPSARRNHTAVWTGTEVIVWGGCSDAGCSSVTSTGGRYDPLANGWRPTRRGNVSPRRNHTAVWTGAEMIVWGGCSNFGCSSVTNTGGRYDPATDAWTATSLTNAPSARDFHTAVWTGTEMIVWGGATDAGFTDTGGRYNPATDAWTATSLTDAPSARSNHTAVWTGTQMIVWGGCSNFGCSSVTNTGGRYDPATDNWKTTSLTNAPSARADYTAVWTGTEMIVWGGDTGAGVMNTGGRYDPAFDTWTATSPTNAPSARRNHTAVWTGTEMIVWGGRNSSTVLGDGGRYCANRLPFAQDDAYTTQEDTFLNVPSPGVLGNDTDPEGQPLTAVLMQSPTQGTLTLNADGSFTYMPNPNFCGLDFFEYVASDGVYSSPFATVTLTVVCQNDPPVAQDDAYITQEDTPLNAPSPGVLGNDTDPEGQPLTAVLVSGPTQGTLTLNADGSFTYTPNPNFCILDSFTYAASDGGHLSNVATVLLMVVCQNDPPVAQDDAYTTQEGTPLNVPSPGVLGNDTDPDIWDPLTAVLDSGPTQGSLTLNADGSFTYTPNSNFCGLDSFTYRAFDGSLQSNVATVTLTVTCPTMSPVGLTLLNVGPEGVWDSGEAVTVVPAWQNNSAQAVTAAGTASNVVNPPGVAASLTDTAADYGTIPAGGTADCQAATGNCYGITGSRTVWGHRDVTLDETVNGTFGVHRAFVQTWVLHMGPSFADVGVTDFFYRHVETLLHRGITGGCTATTYCPFNSVLRYQMAIFISRSKLGGDPPAAGSGPGGSWDCTDGNPNPFTDVPDGAFYCPHVHWMWANNITSGCTATTYCPGDPVNRAQTAVFLVRAFQLVLYGP